MQVETRNRRGASRVSGLSPTRFLGKELEKGAEKELDTTTVESQSKETNAQITDSDSHIPDTNEQSKGFRSLDAKKTRLVKATTKKGRKVSKNKKNDADTKELSSSSDFKGSMPTEDSKIEDSSNLESVGPKGPASTGSEGRSDAVLEGTPATASKGPSTSKTKKVQNTNSNSKKSKGKPKSESKGSSGKSQANSKEGPSKLKGSDGKANDGKGSKGKDGKGSKGSDGKTSKCNDGKTSKCNDGEGSKVSDGKGSKRNNEKGLKGNNEKGLKGNGGKGSKSSAGKGLKGSDGKGAKGNDGKGSKESESAGKKRAVENEGRNEYRERLKNLKASELTREQLVKTVKACQKFFPDLRTAWNHYTAINGNGTKDPEKQEEELLRVYILGIQDHSIGEYLKIKNPHRGCEANEIFVGGVGLISPERINSYFKQFGALRYVDVRCSRGYAFVKFAEKVDMDRCVKCQVHVIEGIRVEVKLAENRDPREKDVQSAAAEQRSGNKGGKKGSMREYSYSTSLRYTNHSTRERKIFHTHAQQPSNGKNAKDVSQGRDHAKFGFKKHLEKLKSTVSGINDFLFGGTTGGSRSSFGKVTGKRKDGERRMILNPPPIPKPYPMQNMAFNADGSTVYLHPVIDLTQGFDQHVDLTQTGLAAQAGLAKVGLAHLSNLSAVPFGSPFAENTTAFEEFVEGGSFLGMDGEAYFGDGSAYFDENGNYLSAETDGATYFGAAGETYFDGDGTYIVPGGTTYFNEETLDGRIVYNDESVDEEPYFDPGMMYFTDAVDPNMIYYDECTAFDAGTHDFGDNSWLDQLIGQVNGKQKALQ